MITIQDGGVRHSSQLWRRGTGFNVTYDADGVPTLSVAGSVEQQAVEVSDSNTAATEVTGFVFQGDVLDVNAGLATFKFDSRYMQLGATIPWSQITNRPTTLNGYGITDAYTITQLQTPASASFAAENLTGSIADARLSANVALRGFNQFSNYQEVMRTPATSAAFAARITGEASIRWLINVDGLMQWGPGTGGGTPYDTNLYRSAANVLRTDDNFDALALRIGGTQVIGSTRVLAGVTTDAGIVTSGTFGVPRGGTGLATVASGSILVGAGTAAMTALAPGAARRVLIGSSSTAWSSRLLEAADIPSHTHVTGDIVGTVAPAQGGLGMNPTGLGAATIYWNGTAFSTIANTPLPTAGNLKYYTLATDGSLGWADKPSGTIDATGATAGQVIQATGSGAASYNWGAIFPSVTGSIGQAIIYTGLTGGLPTYAGGNVDWAYVGNVPVYTTRWPAFSEVTGTASVSQGGTGRTSLTSGNLLLGAGTSAITQLAPGTVGYYLRGSSGSAWAASALLASDLTGTFGSRLGWDAPFVRAANSTVWATGYNLANDGFNNSALSGALVLTTGFGTSTGNNMFVIKIIGRLHGTATPVELMVSGYVTAAGTILTVSHTVSHVDFTHSVRLALNAAGFLCVILGETSSSWSYPRLFVPYAGVGYSAGSGRGPVFEGWSFSAVTDLSAYTAIITSINETNAQYLNGQSAAYYLDAANLTGSISDARLSSNVVLENASNVFSGFNEVVRATPSAAFGIRETGNAWWRLVAYSYGTLLWGDGSVAGDTNLYRHAANFLRTDDAFGAASYRIGTTEIISSGMVLSSVQVPTSLLSGQVPPAQGGTGINPTGLGAATMYWNGTAFVTIANSPLPTLGNLKYYTMASDGSLGWADRPTGTIDASGTMAGQVLQSTGSGATSYGWGPVFPTTTGLVGQALIYAGLNGGLPVYAGGNVDWAYVNAPATFPPSAHSHSAADVTSGTLGVARGGTGVSSVTAGVALVGSGTGPLGAVAPGAAGGFFRSNGTAWVRGTIQASDIPSHTHVEADLPTTHATRNVFNGGIRMPDGTALLPSVSIGQDDLGFWRNATNRLGLAGGVDVTRSITAAEEVTARSGGLHPAQIGLHSTYPGFAAFWRGGNPHYAVLADTTNLYLNANSATGFVRIRRANLDLAWFDGDGSHTASWFRNAADATGIVNSVNGCSWFPTTATGRWISQSGNGIELRTTAGAVRGYLHFNSDAFGSFGLVDSGFNWRVRAHVSGVEMYGTAEFDGPAIFKGGATKEVGGIGYEIPVVHWSTTDPVAGDAEDYPLGTLWLTAQ